MSAATFRGSAASAPSNAFAASASLPPARKSSPARARSAVPFVIFPLPATRRRNRGCRGARPCAPTPSNLPPARQPRERPLHLRRRLLGEAVRRAVAENHGREEHGELRALPVVARLLI